MDIASCGLLSWMAALIVMGAWSASEAGATPRISRSAVVQSLDGKPECVVFRWALNKRGGTRVGIDVPVKIDGRNLWFQLDTGADTDVIYGAIADQAGWSKPSDKAFRPATLQVGATRMLRPDVRIHRELDADETSGTLGLGDLIGRVVVIDYYDRKFCLFQESRVPDVVSSSASDSAVLRDGKFFLSVRVGTFHSDSIIFDTGSSQFPLIVDLATWRELTGLSDPMTSPNIVDGSAWSRPVNLRGAAAGHVMTVGSFDVKAPIVFTQPSDPDMFSHAPFKADGIIGNAPFEGGIVVLDLTERVGFGYIE